MPSSVPETLEVEIFRAGDYGEKGNFAGEDLEKLAGDYDPSLHEAPVTLDHRQNGPAEGWVAGLRHTGGRLIAKLSRLSPSLREMIAGGAYKKRSVELYRRFRDTDRPYLRAVSFLGAASPEVKGLADPVFRDEDAGGVVRFDEILAPSLQEHKEAATTARARLIEAHRWNPAWEQTGLLDVFEQIGPGGLLDRLVDSLSQASPPVSFGETPSENLLQNDGFNSYAGSPSPESIQLHRAAMAFLANHPEATYTEALVRVSQ